MNLHVLLPTHNRQDLLRRCLNSLEQMAVEFTGATVHVIENGSAVAEQIANSYRDRLPVRYHHFAQGNKSLALNAVVQTLPKDSLLVFFDDDVAVRPGTIAAFRAAGEKYGPKHYFGGVLHPDYDAPPSKDVIPYLPPSARKIDHSNGTDYREFGKFRFFMGAIWACFLEDLTGAGSFDKQFGPGASSGARGQETDAQLRLYTTGCQPVFVRAAAVDHYVAPHMVTADYAVERIFLASIHKGEQWPGFVHTLGMLTKLAFSSLLLPLQPNSVGHRYRIAKAAGYFRGLAKRSKEK
ncbi:glycosyltransferase family 2 protein [Neolewinella aurantiaca]|nr:glycosyltransferase family A protein [Neolewinella aurantiaca]